MASLGAPKSIQQAQEQAKRYEYVDYIPLRQWLRSADTMLKQAQIYELEQNDQEVFVLLLRHADLVLEKLAKHPERSLPENKKALRLARDSVMTDLQKLEILRPRIEKRYNEYMGRRKAQQKALESLEGNGANANTLAAELDGLALHGSNDERYPYERATLDAGANRSLAAKLAQREVRRRDAARRGVRQAGVSDEEEQERRTGGVWGSWEKDYRRESNEVDQDDLSKQIQEVARLQNGHASTNFSRPPSQGTSHYHYPSVPHNSAQQRWSGSDTSFGYPGAPARPPKERIAQPSDSVLPPALPPKPPKPPTSIPSPFEQPRPPPIPGKYAVASPSSGPPIPGKFIDRSDSPSLADTPELDEFTFKPSAYLENGNALRTVFLPPTLRHQFLACASSNTRLNLETCGILCGILKSNALFITRLLIPEQTSTSDTCETVNEQDMFDYCDREEVMVLGWIHTHPSQTCFMSSRDLHTHVGYQVMMPESIAIVCAPSKSPSWGVFRLTDPPGKQEILNCTRPGIFHPHDIDKIYIDALSPGHVVELPNAPLEVIDMRKKK
ncbi:hypothetical protein B0J11DRAFT_8462 [Dendryphion nanum]|uniref:MPN domain-containing protein n=1 Tax=Dendryphion nanum TaxID=256645 RepID=A0A9P9EIN7_9PLEO|nr:hypothetical protein B0J11DRAFT_8462 [Dendryphion nanum]